MREIKFRAWDKIEKVMQIPKTLEELLKMAVNSSGIHLEKAIIMQYIGLKDKNGKEIYENDFVLGYLTEEDKETLGIKSYGQIKYNELTGGYLFDDGYNFYDVTNEMAGEDELLLDKDFEIVGNLYENPELLKKLLKEI